MGRRCRFVREQRHVCGDNYMEIDLYPISEREKGASLSAKRRQASSRIQQNLNARNARRYFIQLLNAILRRVTSIGRERMTTRTCRTVSNRRTMIWSCFCAG